MGQLDAKAVIKVIVIIIALVLGVLLLNNEALGDTVKGLMEPQDIKSIQSASEKFIKESKKVHIDDIRKDPKTYKNEKMQFYGKVLEAEKGVLSGDYEYIVTVTVDVEATRKRAKDNPNDTSIVWDYSDVIKVSYEISDGEAQIESGDTIEIYGTFKSMDNFKKKNGETIQLPYVQGKYVSIQ